MTDADDLKCAIELNPHPVPPMAIGGLYVVVLYSLILTRLLSPTLPMFNDLVIMSVSAALVAICVAVHYEALRLLSKLISTDPQVISARGPHQMRWRIAAMVLGLITTHIIETWLFAFAFFGMEQIGYGSLSTHPSTLIDCAYFSVVTYTTLGYGDITPTGPLRLTCAMEALTGMLLVGWSIAFMVVRMGEEPMGEG